MTQFYVTHRDFKHFEQLYSKYKDHPKVKGHFVQIFLGIYWGALLNESSKEEQYALKYLKKEFKRSTFAKQGPLGKELRAVLDFQQLKQMLAQKNLDSFPLHTLPGKFNEKHFNKNLESYLAELKAFTTQITAHVNTGYPQIVTYGHQMIYRRYQRFAKSLLEFEPLEVQKHYKKTFQQTMGKLGNQFLKEAQRQRRQALGLMEKQKVLLIQGHQIDLGDEHIINRVGYRHPASFYVLTLDQDRDNQRKKTVMNIYLPLTLLALLSSCSITRTTLRTSKADQDTFKRESFLRYSSQRLDQLQNTPYKGLAQCHQGKPSKRT